MYGYNSTLPNWMEISVWSSFSIAKNEWLLPTLKSHLVEDQNLKRFHMGPLVKVVEENGVWRQNMELWPSVGTIWWKESELARVQLA